MSRHQWEGHSRQRNSQCQSPEVGVACSRHSEVGCPHPLHYTSWARCPALWAAGQAAWGCGTGQLWDGRAWVLPGQFTQAEGLPLLTCTLPHPPHRPSPLLTPCSLPSLQLCCPPLPGFVFLWVAPCHFSPCPSLDCPCPGPSRHFPSLCLHLTLSLSAALRLFGADPAPFIVFPCFLSPWVSFS